MTKRETKPASGETNRPACGTNRDQSEPAFPVPSSALVDEGGAVRGYLEEYGAGPHPGMTLRQWFAGQALVGLCPKLGRVYPPPATWAREAYELADAMLAAGEPEPVPADEAAGQVTIPLALYRALREFGTAEAGGRVASAAWLREAWDAYVATPVEEPGP